MSDENNDVNKSNEIYTKAKPRVEGIFIPMFIVLEKCDNIKIKLGIDRAKCLYFTSLNSRIITFLAPLEK